MIDDGARMWEGDLLSLYLQKKVMDVCRIAGSQK
jgi:hypothetical protein